MVLTSIYFIILIYFLSLCNSKYVPKARYATSSVLVKDRLYFIGGLGSSSDCYDDLFQLDISKTFNSTEPPFENIINLPEKICWMTSSMAEGGKNIYIFGGKSSLIYSYDFNT